MFRYQNSMSTNDETEALGILKHLNKDELQQLLDDEGKMSELIQDLAQVRNISSGKEELIASNKSLAEYNLQREPRLVQARTQLARVYQQAVDIQKQLDNNKQKLDYSANELSTDTALAVLQSEAAQAEEDSEELSEKFLDGNVAIEEFVDKYIKQRTLAHSRRVKVEKMQEITSKPMPPHSVSKTPQPSAYGASNHNMYPASVPYPSYSGMPNPSSYLPR